MIYNDTEDGLRNNKVSTMKVLRAKSSDAIIVLQAAEIVCKWVEEMKPGWLDEDKDLLDQFQLLYQLYVWLRRLRIRKSSEDTQSSLYSS